jgi:ArsR family transcriptional regulator, lead/cadmium/zinc/bismuth-responsive transcriptional repressor
MTAETAPSQSSTTRDADRCDILHVDQSKLAELRRAMIGPEAGSALAETFKLLGDLTRVRILDGLSKSELCVCEIAALVGLSESAVSHQLRLLRGLRLVRSRRAGRMVFYSLDDDHIVTLLQQGLRHVAEAWASPARVSTAAPAVRLAGASEPAK